MFALADSSRPPRYFNGLLDHHPSDYVLAGDTTTKLRARLHSAHEELAARLNVLRAVYMGAQDVRVRERVRGLVCH